MSTEKRVIASVLARNYAAGGFERMKAEERNTILVVPTYRYRGTGSEKAGTAPLSHLTKTPRDRPNVIGALQRVPVIYLSRLHATIGSFQIYSDDREKCLLPIYYRGRVKRPLRSSSVPLFPYQISG